MPFSGAPKDSSLIIPADQINSFDRACLVKFIEQKIVPDGLFHNTEKTNQVRAELIAFYADRKETDKADAHFYLTRYTQVN